MLFNFQTYINDLRQNDEKKAVIIKYEKFFGSIKGTIQNQLWYKEYVSKFPPFSYATPDTTNNDFDWDLLCSLVASSFSSDCFYLNKDGKEEFLIDVQHRGKRVKKLASELWGFQILRLYEIYCAEQMNLQILIAEDKKEEQAILAQRNSRLKKWKKQIDSMPIKNYIYLIESEVLNSLE